MTIELLAEVRRVGDTGTVHVEDVYDTDIDDLWRAVTEPDRLARWIASVEGDLRVGGTIRAEFTSSFEGPGRIDVCDAPHRLQVTMNPGTPDETRLEAVLTAEERGTRLVVEECGLPADAAPDHAAGWQAHLEDLRAHLDGRAPGDWRARWRALIPAYRPELGS
jgi:uncharacterized protein YndB with AHSA1/START domain